MKARLWRIAKLGAYPLFYLLALVGCFYLSFPFDALRSRLLVEFDRTQRSSAGRATLSGGSTKSPMQLELKELDGYWLSGVEARGVRLIIPTDKRAAAAMPGLAKATASGEEASAEQSVVAVEHAYARVRLLPLLIGRMRVNFGADVFGGEVSGTLPYGGSSGDVEVELSKLQLGEVQPLRSLLGGLPVLGTVNGEIQLAPVDGRFAKAEGKLELKLGNVVVGDGKALLQGVALPAAQIGDIVITGTAKDGLFKIAEISAVGRDLELQGEGKIRIREPWLRSQADIYLKFRFTDAYRDHDDATRGLLGAPGGKFPAAIDYNATVKRAKQEDGFYAWHIHGALSDLAFDPMGGQAKAGRTRLPTGAQTPAGRTTPPGRVRRSGAPAGGDRGEEANAPAGDGVRQMDTPRLAPAPDLAPPAAPGAPPEAAPAPEPAAPDDSQPRPPEEPSPTPPGDTPAEG